MTSQNEKNRMNQLYIEYKLLLDETDKDDKSTKDALTLQFKQKFLNQFDHFEPTDTIRLLYEYFCNIISEESERQIFFDYNLLMFEIIAAKLVRKPKILDVWFDPTIENRKKFNKLLLQTETELFICSQLTNYTVFKKIFDDLIVRKPNIIIKLLFFIKENQIIQDNEYIMEKNNENVKVGYIYREQCKSFVVIDKKILINGIFEWDMEPNDKSSDNMILIENESLTRAFLKNFEGLWEKRQIKLPQSNIINNSSNNNQREKKKYKKIGLIKFKEIMSKFKKRKKKNGVIKKKNIRKKPKIIKVHQKKGMFSNIFGFFKKIIKK